MNTGYESKAAGNKQVYGRVIRSDVQGCLTRLVINNQTISVVFLPNELYGDTESIQPGDHVIARLQLTITNPVSPPPSQTTPGDKNSSPN
jgi:hypothetical protein